jgi:hypothetical protein
MDLKSLDQPKSITALLWPAANPHFARFDHFLRCPHAVEVGEISTGLRLNSRLHHTSAESNYWPTDMELAGLVWSAKTLRPYMERSFVWFVTDHKPNIDIFDMKTLQTTSTSRSNLRLQTWGIYLSQFWGRMQVIYSKGANLDCPDALSRLAYEVSDNAKRFREWAASLGKPHDTAEFEVSEAFIIIRSRTLAKASLDETTSVVDSSKNTSEETPSQENTRSLAPASAVVAPLPNLDKHAAIHEIEASSPILFRNLGSSTSCPTARSIPVSISVTNMGCALSLSSCSVSPALLPLPAATPRTSRFIFSTKFASGARNCGSLTLSQGTAMAGTGYDIRSFPVVPVTAKEVGEALKEVKTTDSPVRPRTSPAF